MVVCNLCLLRWLMRSEWDSSLATRRGCLDEANADLGTTFDLLVSRLLAKASQFVVVSFRDANARLEG